MQLDPTVEMEWKTLKYNTVRESLILHFGENALLEMDDETELELQSSEEENTI
jgi:hypothetical protein